MTWTAFSHKWLIGFFHCYLCLQYDSANLHDKVLVQQQPHLCFLTGWL